MEFISFLFLSFIIAITPGPSIIYVISYSLRYGSKAGIISTLGVNVGSVFAILLSAFGFSYILAMYPNTVVFIQLLGGLYVVYLAKLTWPRDNALTIEENNLVEENYTGLFKKGFVTSILNPKDILFYIAFVPTFIPQSIEGYNYQTYFLLLAFCYLIIGFTTKSIFAFFAGYMKRLLKSNRMTVVNYFSSLSLFVLGLYLIVMALLTI